MTALVAGLGSVALALALAALRLGPPAPRGATRRPGTAPGPPPPRSPGWLEPLLVFAGLSTDPTLVWSAIRWAVPLSLAAMALVVSPPIAMVVGGGVLLAPRAMRPALQRRVLDRRDAQLPASLERLASALRAGSAPGPAFIELATVAPEPLGAELQAVAAEIEHGAGMVTALDRWAGRSGASPAVRLTAAALGLGVAAGGEVARSMDRVAATLRERRELQAEVHSLATQARASAAVLGLAPVAFTALVSTVEPEVLRFLLAEPLGLLCLACGTGLEGLGVVWMARIVASAS